MAWLQFIEDDAGQSLATLRAAHDEYQLPDGSEMFVDTQPAWCRGCRRFVMIEELASPEELETTAREFATERLRRPLKIFSQQFEEQMTQKLLSEGLAAAHQWRIALSRRISAPRCLECGGAAHLPLPPKHEWLSHPDIPYARVRVADRLIHASMDRGRLYDTEGRRIPRLKAPHT